MMTISPRVWLLASLAIFMDGQISAAPLPAEAPAPAVAQGLCDALIDSMKKGATTDFSARKELLAPEIHRDFNLAFMTRIIVGPMWASVPATDGNQLVEAFSDYTISTYAQRFKSFDGERFEVDPTPTTMPKGDVVVHTKLFTGSGEPVKLDYLMRKSAVGWQAIDIFLSGTISELATRRSEYSAILRQGGAPALAELLKKKTTELASPAKAG